MPHSDNPSLPDSLYNKITGFVNKHMGLNFPPERRADLESGLHAAAQETGYCTVEDYVAWLLSAATLSKSQIEELAGHLTIGETYFFRNPEQFTLLEQLVLPELIRLKAKGEKLLRIWCAGCSTGEEPYSVAISLRRVIPDIAHWKITILATDINARFLRQGQEACYSEWSFRDAPTWLKDGYFHKHGTGLWKLNSPIREMVTFGHLNLAEDPYPSLVNNTSAMDIIFCRNVLIYFDAPNARRVVSGFYRSLLETGWLFVGPTDTFLYQDTDFGPAEQGCITCYRRFSKKVQRPLPEYQPEPIAVEEPPLPSPDHAPSTTPYKYALALYHKGHYEKSITLLLHELAKPEGIGDHTGPSLALLARLFANVGKLNESLEWCNQAIAQDKVNPRYHYLRATILQEQGELDPARESLRRTLFLDQEFIIAQFAIGNIWRAEGKLQESRHHFKNALALLKRHSRTDLLPESDGLTAGQLEDRISSVLNELEEKLRTIPPGHSP